LKRLTKYVEKVSNFITIRTVCPSGQRAGNFRRRWFPSELLQIKSQPRVRYDMTNSHMNRKAWWCILLLTVAVFFPLGLSAQTPSEETGFYYTVL
jgi:hypothetical protein